MKNPKGIIALSAGVLLILFAVFWFLWDDLNGGEDQRIGVAYYIFEGLILLVGIFLIVIGFRRWRRTKTNEH
jgi:hypothetical protein